ncbi:aldo/keto reductase [Mangrovitalea sediminis]|uniref:aldo/keto reductase n=1 Tax=Mangrovitalea sediminis TaxID=1982043 RepID=UPI000BE4CB36|nr:aldo/keto reductase [Mangrovitalea sediminis]
MLLRRLGSTDLEISPLGLGTVKFGRNKGVKYPEAFELPDDETLLDLLACTRDLGINFLDTAPAYGESEARLGRLLRGQRQHWILATKAGESFDPESGESSYDFTPEALIRSVETSLRRLATDYLDLVMIHSDGDDERIIHRLGALEVLADLKKRGWIRASGMSTKTVAGGLAALGQSDCAMVTLNIDDLEQLPVIEQARTSGKGIIIKKALASGHTAKDQARQDPVREAFELSLTQPGVTSVVVGTINRRHLEANVAIANQILASSSH